MKRLLLLVTVWAWAASALWAQDATTLASLEEKIGKLRAELEDVQFRLRKSEEETAALRKELREARAGLTAEQLQALEARIAAVDAARQRDKAAIIDQLAKELAAIAGGGVPTPTRHSGATSSGDPKHHVVQRGETLSSIARQHGVTVADLRKANNLTSDSLNVDQKLVIPK
jgi:LysM repeat protein